jgi:hypothetical protein
MGVEEQVAFQGRQSYCDVDPDEYTLLQKVARLVQAAEKLLEFQPTFSKGSTGYIRHERLGQAIKDVLLDSKGNKFVSAEDCIDYLLTSGDHYGVKLLRDLVGRK